MLPIDSPTPAAGRTIVIGDLHGCHDEALELLERIGASDGDRIIFAGDLVDRGPEPRACVELAMRHEAILGNHEDNHLKHRRSSLDRLKPDHARTRRQLEPSHLDWMSSLPSFIRLPESNAVVVHAGVLPGIGIEDQDSHTLLHAQCVSPPRKKSYWPSKAPEGFSFWANHWRGPERVIFGHTVLDRPLVTEWAVGIDTGCVHGGALTAVVLPGWRIVSVPARAAHGGPRGDGVARFHVMDGVRCWS